MAKRSIILDLSGKYGKHDLQIFENLEREFPDDIAKIYSEHYIISKNNYKVRAMCITRTLFHVRTNNDMVDLAMKAVLDKSHVVRGEAFMALAYSQREDIIPQLKNLRGVIHEKSKLDLEAAIDAIENKNHNLFFDRKHTGNITWNVQTL